MILAFVLILILDIPHLRRDFKQQMKRNIKSRFCYDMYMHDICAELHGVGETSM